jgi:hypothetical protein
MDLSSLYKVSYGLYVLTAFDGEKHNGCIINTAIQQTSVEHLSRVRPCLVTGMRLNVQSRYVQPLVGLAF